MSNRLVVFSILVAGASAIGAYSVHVGDARTPRVSLAEGKPAVSRPGPFEINASGLNPPSQSDPSGTPEAMPDRHFAPKQDADYHANFPPVPLPQKRGPTHAVNDTIEDLLGRAVRSLRGGASQDLLRFILEEDINEFGMDIDAAKSFDEAILTAATARGMSPVDGSGVTDIVCTMSLCTFVAEPLGTFNVIRQTPEWYAMEQEGPVPGIRSLQEPARELGPAQSWIRFGIRSSGGKTQVYYYRPGIERHRELLEAVVAPPSIE